MFAFATLSFVSASAQQNPFPMNKENTQAEYAAVVDVAGVSAAELHQRAENWIKAFYPNPTGVIKKNEAGNLIEGTARFRLNSKDKKGAVLPQGGMVSYQIELMFKDGKCKYRFHRIRWEQSSYFDVSKWLDTKDPDYNASVYQYNIEQTTEYMDGLIKSLSAALKTAPEKQNSDW